MGSSTNGLASFFWPPQPLRQSLHQALSDQRLLRFRGFHRPCERIYPLPAPASTPPEGFCQRNEQGKLLVRVYNQGGTKAGESTPRIVFDCGDPQCSNPISTDVTTPEILPGSGRNPLLVFDIPDECWDGNNNCKFTIGVDVENAVLESNETNNNAAELCGAQFQ